MSKSTGTSMQGHIEYTRNKKLAPLLCDCRKCTRSRMRGKDFWHCQYYDLIKPVRKKCVRYMGPTIKPGTQYVDPPKKKKRKKSAKKASPEA